MEQFSGQELNSDDIFPRSKSCKKNKGKHFNDPKTKQEGTQNTIYTVKHSEKYKKSIKTQPERQEMLERIKSQEQEIEFLQSVASHFLDINELMKIKQNSFFDAENNSWTVPSFEVQKKKTVFPNLQRSVVDKGEIKRKKIVIKHDAVESNAYKTVYNERPLTSFASRRSQSKNEKIQNESLKFKFIY